MQGKKFSIKDRKAGINFPPFHSWCRCSYTIAVDDWDKWMDDYVEKHSKKPETSVKSVAKSDESGIIKSLDIDDFELLTYGKNLDKDVQAVIFNTIKERENRGELFVSEIFVGSIPASPTGIPVLQIEPISDGILRLNINTDVFAGKTLSEVDKMFAGSKINLAISLEEAVIHECGHAKSIKGLKIREIKEMYRELSLIHIAGISDIAYADGAECLAEIEILLSRGSDIPDEALGLYNKYVRRLQR